MSDRAKLEQRGRAIAAMGLVQQDRTDHNIFSVSTPSFRGQQTSYKVRRDDEKDIVTCNCLAFEEMQANGEKSFECEHILAVNYHFQQKSK